MSRISQVMSLVATRAQNTPPSEEHPLFSWSCSLSRVRILPFFPGETPSLVTGLFITVEHVSNVERSIAVESEPEENPMNYQKYQLPSSILASGNTSWNTWRRDYADVQAFEPDLHAVDLHQEYLQGIDFHEADLTEANLQNADLRGADLRAADLRHADLRGADLSDAKLQEAQLHGADLRDARLCRAMFQGADLSAADLRGADLSAADFKKAILEQTQFTEVSPVPPDPKIVDPALLLEREKQRLARIALRVAAAA